MLRDNITLIIPVRFRQYTLPRILNYYKDTDFPIVVCDATEKPYDGIDKFPWVEYWHQPNRPHVDFMVDVLAETHTKYSVNIGDDDFLLIPAIDYCIKYMEEHDDCVATNGQEAALNDNYLEYETIHYIIEQLYPMNFEDPKERMDYTWKYFTAKNHCIIRTDAHFEVFRFVQEYPDLFAIRFLDKILSLILARRGNITSLPIFFNLRSCESRAPTMRDHHALAKEIKSHLRFETDFLNRDLSPLYERVGLTKDELTSLYHKLVGVPAKIKRFNEISTKYGWEYSLGYDCKYPLKPRKCNNSGKQTLFNCFPIFETIPEINRIVDLIQEYPL